MRSGPGAARTILPFHIISARPSKQPLMVRTFLKVYMELGSYFLFLQEQIKDIIIIIIIICHCWGLTCGCLRTSPAGHPCDVAASRGRPLVDARRWLCAGFWQCGSFVEVFVVDCLLSIGGWVVLVRGGCACRVVGVGLRSGAVLVYVCLDVVPLLPRSS